MAFANYNYVRQDDAYDYIGNCGPGPRYQDRKKNPNPKNKVEVTASILSAKIYPNPNNGGFNLAYSFPSGSGRLFITDISGRQIFDMDIIGNKGIQLINLSELPNGIYYWKIITGNEIPPNGKIVILK